MNSYAEDYVQIIEQEISVLDKEISKMISDLHNLNKAKTDLRNLLEIINAGQTRDSTDN